APPGGVGRPAPAGGGGRCSPPGSGGGSPACAGAEAAGLSGRHTHGQWPVREVIGTERNRPDGRPAPVRGADEAVTAGNRGRWSRPPRPRRGPPSWGGRPPRRRFRSGRVGPPVLGR